MYKEHHFKELFSTPMTMTINDFQCFSLVLLLLSLPLSPRPLWQKNDGESRCQIALYSANPCSWPPGHIFGSRMASFATPPHFWNISGYCHNFEIASFACNPNPLNASCCFNCVGRLRNEQEVVQVGQVQPIGGDHYQTADPPETRLYSGRQNGHPSAPLNDSDGRRPRLRTSGGSVSLEMHILPEVQPSTLSHPPSPTSPLSDD